MPALPPTNTLSESYYLFTYSME